MKPSAFKYKFSFCLEILLFFLILNKSEAQITPMAKLRGLGQYGIQSISAGAFHTCVILDNGSVKCWGLNGSGQLGLGNTANRGDAANEMGDKLPVVNLGTNRTARSIDTGGYHTCAILDNGIVKCWGDNSYGQLGLGDSEDRGDAANEMGENLPAVNLGTNRSARSLALGEHHSCAILDNGSTKCWGRGAFGQLGSGGIVRIGDGAGEMGDSLAVVDLGTNRSARSLAAGSGHTCAILDNGTVKCWGYNSNGQLGLGDTANRGDEAGEMGESLPVVNLGTNRSARVLVAGGEHNCALLDNGTLKCWGDNLLGQLGLGNMNDRGDEAGEMGESLPAIDLGTNRSAKNIVAGAYFNCAILDNGATKCWGVNTNGQLGLEDTAVRGNLPNEMGENLPAVNLGTNRSARSLIAGGVHTCALLDNGTLKCWGADGNGQLGLGDTVAHGDAANEMGDYLTAIKLGKSKNKISTEVLKPMGDASPELFEETGQGNNLTLATGPYQNCVILDNGKVKCWGRNTSGQLGLGDSSDRGNAVSEMGDHLNTIDLGTNRTARSLSGGGNFMCALLDNNTVKCWGNGGNGQLGQGVTGSIGDASSEMGDNITAINLGTNRTARSITSGQFHTCAILDSGVVKCWGGNTYGQLGLGDTSDRGDGANEMGENLPIVDLGTNRTARKIVARENFTCALLDNGTVKCWGQNDMGQLGLGDTNSRGDGASEMGENLPAIDFGSNRTARNITLGSDFACALLDNGTVKCWGQNDNGQLGLGDINPRGDAGSEMGSNLPVVDLGTNRTARSVVAGYYHTCAILDNGTTKCWGTNWNGHLGLGSTHSKGDGANEMGDNLATANVGTNRSVRSLSLGASHTCAILDNGSTKCWGVNNYGQLGLGDVSSRGDAANEMGDKLRPLRFGR